MEPACRVHRGRRHTHLALPAAVALRPVGVLQGLPAVEPVAARVLHGVHDVDGDPAADDVLAAQTDEFGGAAGQAGDGERRRDPAVAEHEGALPLAARRTGLRPEGEPPGQHGERVEPAARPEPQPVRGRRVAGGGAHHVRAAQRVGPQLAVAAGVARAVRAAGGRVEAAVGRQVLGLLRDGGRVEVVAPEAVGVGAVVLDDRVVAALPVPGESGERELGGARVVGMVGAHELGASAVVFGVGVHGAHRGGADMAEEGGQGGDQLVAADVLDLADGTAVHRQRGLGAQGALPQVVQPGAGAALGGRLLAQLEEVQAHLVVGQGEPLGGEPGDQVDGFAPPGVVAVAGGHTGVGGAQPAAALGAVAGEVRCQGGALGVVGVGVDAVALARGDDHGGDPVAVLQGAHQVGVHEVQVVVLVGDDVQDGAGGFGHRPSSAVGLSGVTATGAFIGPRRSWPWRRRRSSRAAPTPGGPGAPRRTARPRRRPAGRTGTRRRP